MNFTSDNAYGADPAIMAALAGNCDGAAVPYGGDDFTARVNEQLSDIFAHEVVACPVITGTAANSLALATLSPPYGAIFCHERSHVAVDECGAPEFFSHGAKLIGLAGEDGKITSQQVEASIGMLRPGVHGPRPSVLSISQLSEAGTAYRPDEIESLARTAHDRGMSFHMDGARFANALCRLGCEPADISWRAGVDAISFGATKNGALGAEAVLFFDRSKVAAFEYLRKKSGHLLSKMRFVSIQLAAYLENDRWLENARRANALASRIADAFAATRQAAIAHPVDGNIVFVVLPTAMAKALRASAAIFHDAQNLDNNNVLCRFVTSFATPEAHVEQLVSILRAH